jgi:Zn finger protein HypA/HybF involved in hydrogenase expression
MHASGENGAETRVSSTTMVDVNPGECMVCHHLVRSGEAAIACPNCGGIAHKVHMFEWLHVKGTCPTCRQRIESSTPGTQ